MFWGLYSLRNLLFLANWELLLTLRSFRACRPGGCTFTEESSPPPSMHPAVASIQAKGYLLSRSEQENEQSTEYCSGRENHRHWACGSHVLRPWTWRLLAGGMKLCKWSEPLDLGSKLSSPFRSKPYLKRPCYLLATDSELLVSVAVQRFFFFFF